MALSDIMSLFRTAPTTPPAPTNIPTGVADPGKGLPGTQQTSQTGPNGLVPDQNINPPEPGTGEGTQVSALDKHKGIWDTVTPDPNAPPDTGYFGNVDPVKLLESARKVDFAKVVTPEVLAKVRAGGEDSTAAFLAALNGVAQTVYANSAIATTKIVEQALNKQAEKFDKSIPGLVRKLSANEGLRENNPIFSNPAIAPLVEAMTTQFTTKNPNASATEIQKQVVDYFDSVGMAFAPKAPEPSPGRQGNKAAKSEDWSKFLEIDPN